MAGRIPVVADSRDSINRGFFTLLEFGKRLFDIQARMFFCSCKVCPRIGGFAEEPWPAEDRDFLERIRRAGLPRCRAGAGWIAASSAYSARQAQQVHHVLPRDFGGLGYRAAPALLIDQAWTVDVACPRR